MGCHWQSSWRRPGSRSSPPEALLQRLDTRLPLLTGGARDAPDRQRTLRGAIAWSYDLLPDEERRLFRGLSIFVGGASLEAATHVTAGSDQFEIDTLDGVSSLIDKSLLRHLLTPGGEDRFTILETLREFGLEQIDEEECNAFRLRHAEWFCLLAERALPELLATDQMRWLARLDADHDNIRSALAWSLQQGEVTIAARIALAQWRYWQSRGLLREGCQWLERCVAHAAILPEAVLAAALGNLGGLSYDLGDVAKAKLVYERALELRERLGPQNDLADIIYDLGLVAAARGEYDAAHAYHRRALAIRQEIGEPYDLSLSFNNYAEVFYDQGDFVTAREMSAQALPLRHQMGHSRGIAYVLVTLGKIDLDLGETVLATAELLEALERFAVAGEKIGIGRTNQQLGKLAVREGDWTAASHHFTISLAVQVEMGELRGVAESLEFLAAADHGAEATAVVECLAAAAAFRRSLGIPEPPVTAGNTSRVLAQARQLLGESVYATYWQRGAMATPAAIATIALELPAMSP